MGSGKLRVSLMYITKAKIPELKALVGLLTNDKLGKNHEQLNSLGANI